MQKWPFRVILSSFGGKRSEKLWIGWNWPFRVIMSHFGGKRLEKLQIGQNWPFWPTLVGKDWKSCKSGEIGHSESFLSHFGWKRLEKLQIGWNWPFWVILSHFGGKRLEKLQIGWNWPFWVILSHYLASTFLILGGRGTSDIHSNLLQLFQSWGGVHRKFALTCFNFYNPGGVHWTFTLTCFNFSNPGWGVHLQVDRKSVRFTDSGWLSTAAASGHLC